MRVNKLEYRQVIKESSFLAYYCERFSFHEEDLQKLIDQDSRQLVKNETKKALFGETVIISKKVEEEYLLLKKYTDYFRNIAHEDIGL